MIKDRNLINQIVKEVINHLSFPQETAKPKLLVVGETSFIRPDLLLKINNRWDLVKLQENEKVDLCKVDKVLFLHATQDLLVKGALGVIDTFESKLLSSCILESISISIVPTVYLQEYIMSSNSAKNLYVSRLLDYKETLEKFGAKIETLEQFLEDYMEGFTNQGLPIPALLTQRDVQVSKEKTILVNSRTIITPLARDTVRELEKNIKVID